MKFKYLWLVLPFLFLACEDDTADADVAVTVIGSWNVTSQHEYGNSGCTGTYESALDSIQMFLGADASLTWDFTEVQATQTLTADVTGESLCDMLTEGIGNLNGTNCEFDFYGYNLSWPIDTFCVDMGGVYTNGNCNIVDAFTMDYTVDNDIITFTEFAGTDSVETTTGTFNIAADVLTVTVSDDSSCVIITASKQ